VLRLHTASALGDFRRSAWVFGVLVFNARPEPIPGLPRQQVLDTAPTRCVGPNECERLWWVGLGEVPGGRAGHLLAC
jgi:hypothetical protein